MAMMKKQGRDGRISRREGDCERTWMWMRSDDSDDDDNDV